MTLRLGVWAAAWQAGLHACRGRQTRSGSSSAPLPLWSFVLPAAGGCIRLQSGTSMAASLLSERGLWYNGELSHDGLDDKVLYYNG